MKVVVWLGSAPPVRSSRWLDGALIAAAKFDGATAIAAGDPSWLDLAAERATRAGIESLGVLTDLQLDYLGWAQVVTAAAKQLGVTTVLVDEASRPERWAEVAAIAELLDAAQLTHAVAVAPDGELVHASRIAGTQLQTVRLRGAVVIGVAIASSAVDDAPPLMPAPTAKRVELHALGLDPLVLVHRALPPRSAVAPKQTIERIVEHLAVHLSPRREAP